MASVEKLPSGRWQARWRDPEGRQRKKSFTRKLEADRFLTGVEADKLRGLYIDPDAGRVTLKTYGEQWLASQTFDMTTHQATALRLKNHVFPVLGSKPLNQIKPSTVQAYIKTLEPLAASYRRVIFTNLSSLLSAAVDDGMIVRNPCQAPSVRKPRLEQRKFVVWGPEQIMAMHDALAPRYAIVATIAGKLGLRQGEVFGLSPDDVDFLRGEVHVNRQVKLYANNKQAFGLPKGRKTRTIPLPPSLRDELAAYLAKWPAKAVTLPWNDLNGDPVTHRLILTSREGGSLGRNHFNQYHWRPALVECGIPLDRMNGCHALRHAYGSLLIDGGESLAKVAAYLGHANASFTARIYIHELAGREDRARSIIEGAFSRAPFVPVAVSGTDEPQ